MGIVFQGKGSNERVFHGAHSREPLEIRGHFHAQGMQPVQDAGGVPGWAADLFDSRPDLQQIALSTKSGRVCLVEVRQWLGCSATQGPLIDISMSVVGLRAKVDATIKERFVNGAVGRTAEEAEEAGPLLLARDCLDRIISAAIELSDLEAARQT